MLVVDESTNADAHGNGVQDCVLAAPAIPASARLLRADTGSEATVAEIFGLNTPGIPLWSINERMQLVTSPLGRIADAGTAAVFHVRLASGRRIDATADQGFVTYQGPRPLGDLAVGCRVAVPRRIPTPSIISPWPEAEIVMLAHLIGDGCVAPRQPIHYTSNDEANLVAVEQAAAHFGITPRRVAHETWWHVYLPSPYRLTHGRRNPIAVWLDRFGMYGKRAHEKFLPAGVFALSDDQVILFMRHLWATDGSVTVDRNGRTRIYYATTSERLAQDVQLLLLRLDLRARLHKVGNTRGRPGWTVDITGADDQRSFLRRVGVHGARGLLAAKALESVSIVASNTNVDTIPVEAWAYIRDLIRARSITTRAFQRMLGVAYNGSAIYRSAPARARLAMIADLLQDGHLGLLAASDVLWDTIAEITPGCEQSVFRVVMRESRSLVVDGVFLQGAPADPVL